MKNPKLKALVAKANHERGVDFTPLNDQLCLLIKGGIDSNSGCTTNNGCTVGKQKTR